jgi:hypothetical protein
MNDAEKKAWLGKLPPAPPPGPVTHGPLDIRDTGIDHIINKVSRLYQLVAEMREVINDLYLLDVEVKLTGRSDPNDPLTQIAVLGITLKPGCEFER